VNKAPTSAQLPLTAVLVSNHHHHHHHHHFFNKTVVKTQPRTALMLPFGKFSLVVFIVVALILPNTRTVPTW